MLSRDNGLKLVGQSGVLPGFGRVTMVAFNISGGTVPSMLAWLKVKQIYGDKVEQKVL